MLNYDNFAITLGRAIESFRARPDAVDEHKRALRALVALTRMGAVTLVRNDHDLTVGDQPVAATLPGIGTLLAQMDAHDITQIRIAQKAAPAHLLRFLREIAGGLGSFADGRTLHDRLTASGVTSVTVVSVPPAPPATEPERREPSVTEAFESEAVGRALAEATATTPPPAPLAEMVADLALDPSHPDVLDRATAVADLVRREMDAGRVSAALVSAAELVRLEGRLPEGGPRRSLAIVLNRLLTRSVLQTAAARSREPAHDAAARLLIQRGGGEATEVLLERLIQAETIAERRHYFDLLKTAGEGLRQVILALGHTEWFAVRNVAELLGELRVREAVPPLARTLRHPDPRVRRAAALALARIGTPETLEHLGALLRDPDAELRYAVAAAIGGREMESLAMPLVMAVEREGDPRVVLEFYRALGRLGSSAALQALARGAAPVGWRWWRRRPGRRPAAIEGLKVAGGPVAIGTLESLLEDKDPEIRRAAREALEDLDVM
jgi:hypothetical protein